jgi:hypothetical protein
VCGSVCDGSGGSVDCADCVMRRAWPGTPAGLAPSVSQSELAHPLRGLSTALQNPPRGRGLWGTRWTLAGECSEWYRLAPP